VAVAVLLGVVGQLFDYQDDASELAGLRTGLHDAEVGAEGEEAGEVEEGADRLVQEVAVEASVAFEDVLVRRRLPRAAA
jgi:hypothetical protein